MRLARVQSSSKCGGHTSEEMGGSDMAKMRYGTCSLCERQGGCVECRACKIWLCGVCAAGSFGEPPKCPKCQRFLTPDGVRLVKCPNCGHTKQYVHTIKDMSMGSEPICPRCASPLPRPMGSPGRWLGVWGLRALAVASICGVWLLGLPKSFCIFATVVWLVVLMTARRLAKRDQPRRRPTSAVGSMGGKGI